MAEPLDAVALVYYQPLRDVPPDLAEGIHALRHMSRFPVVPINLIRGVPERLGDLRFRAIVLHFTLFYADLDPFAPAVREWVAGDPSSYKVALFQDEQAATAQKVGFCRDAGVDAVFTCLAPEHGRSLYGRAGVDTVVSCLPGYVSGRLLAAADRWALPDRQRTIDVGYRGRRPPPEWGEEAAEKHQIAVEFLSRAPADLRVDVSTREEDRIYGDDWYRFLGRCRATLGTESGAVIADPDRPGVGLPYRTIAPRHFEAAALGTVQLLYDGAYSGAMQPGVHYVALRKDMANLDEALAVFRDPAARARIAARARMDLIESGRWGYDAFVRSVDDVLAGAGAVTAGEASRFAEIVHAPGPRRSWRRARTAVRHGAWPGYRAAQRVVRALRRR